MIWAGELEVRQDQDGLFLAGTFPYNALAVVNDRGTVRKERFAPGAFEFPVTRFLEIQRLLQAAFAGDAGPVEASLAQTAARQDAPLETPVQALQRELASLDTNLLYGHDFNRPLASRLAGTLTLQSDDAALRFEATLPPAARQPSWMVDAVMGVRSGLVTGISPRFRVPPASVVPNGEELLPEPGNPGVMIRQINQALLPELSLVTRPAYKSTTLELRADTLPPPPSEATLWL